jgi:hypothetical protein
MYRNLLWITALINWPSSYTNSAIHFTSSLPFTFHLRPSEFHFCSVSDLPLSGQVFWSIPCHRRSRVLAPRDSDSSGAPLNCHLDNTFIFILSLFNVSHALHPWNRAHFVSLTLLLLLHQYLMRSVVRESLLLFAPILELVPPQQQSSKNWNEHH